MNYIKYLILFLTSLTSIAQTSIKVESRDTLIDFWFQRLYDNISGYENKVVSADKKVLYVKISFKNVQQAEMEYFRINDSLYKCIKYFPDGDINERGNIKVKNKISGSDTSASYDVDGNEHITVHYYRQIVKTGPWEEFENSDIFSEHWTGIYENNKRKGSWQEMNLGIGDNFIVKTIDYDLDSTKVIYKNNIVQLPTDSLAKYLKGRWTLKTCDKEKFMKMIFYKCRTYKKSYGDVCKDKYYEFLPDKKFSRNRGDGCYAFREASLNGTWQIVKSKDFNLINVTFSDSKENWTFKLIYLDKEGNLITERQ